MGLKNKEVPEAVGRQQDGLQSSTTPGASMAAPEPRILNNNNNN